MGLNCLHQSRVSVTLLCVGLVPVQPVKDQFEDKRHHQPGRVVDRPDPVDDDDESGQVCVQLVWKIFGPWRLIRFPSSRRRFWIVLSRPGSAAHQFVVSHCPLIVLSIMRTFRRTDCDERDQNSNTMNGLLNRPPAPGPPESGPGPSVPKSVVAGKTNHTTMKGNRYRKEMKDDNKRHKVERRGEHQKETRTGLKGTE